MSMDWGTNQEGESLDPEQVLARALARRGDIFDQFRLLVKEAPATYDLISKTAGYVHHYTGKTGAEQQLSGVMRELIALALLAAKGEHVFAPNHVRRLYLHGITNRIMLEAATALASITGWTTVAHTAGAILRANEADYPYGRMPPEGEPRELKPFPELDIGWAQDGSAPDDEAQCEEFTFVASLDPDLARAAARWVNHSLSPERRRFRLGPGPRELVAVAGCCFRGEVEFAAQHMRRAYAYGMNRVQVLESVSCVLPMTGALTLKIGAQAMQLAERANA